LVRCIEMKWHYSSRPIDGGKRNNEAGTCLITTVARVNGQCAIGIHVRMPGVIYKLSGRNGCYVDPTMAAPTPFEHAHVVTGSEAEAELRHDEATAAASA
jgi:hypothetical protein